MTKQVFNMNLISSRSVNKVSISQDLVIARIHIIDHMEKKNLKLGSIEPSSQLIRFIKVSRQRYSTYLGEQKKLKDKSKKNDQIEMLNAELQDVLSKKK